MSFLLHPLLIVIDGQNRTSTVSYIASKDHKRTDMPCILNLQRRSISFPTLLKSKEKLILCCIYD